MFVWMKRKTMHENIYTTAILYVVFDRQNEDMILVYGTFKCWSTMGWKAAMGMWSSANPTLKMDEPLSIMIALLFMSTTVFLHDRWEGSSNELWIDREREHANKRISKLLNIHACAMQYMLYWVCSGVPKEQNHFFKTLEYRDARITLFRCHVELRS